MSAFLNYQVTKTSIEKEWMRDVVNYITGLDSRITCSNDVDDEYDSSKWDAGTNHVPTFIFSINNIPYLKIERGENLATNALFTRSSSPLNSSIVKNDQFFSKAWNQGGINQVLERSCNISSIISNGFIMIVFGGLSDYFNAVAVVYSESGTNEYFAEYFPSYSKESIFNVSGNATFYKLESGSVGSSQGTFLSRFSYACPPGQIDYIKSSIYQNNNAKVFELASLYDCTTVILGNTVSLKDGAYLAVGTHQLVKV